MLHEINGLNFKNLKAFVVESNYKSTEHKKLEAIISRP